MDLNISHKIQNKIKELILKHKWENILIYNFNEREELNKNGNK